MEGRKENTGHAQGPIGLLLVAAVAVAILAQYYFARKREYVWDGLLLYAVAGALFARAVRLLEPPTRQGEGMSLAGVWTCLWEALGCSAVRAMVLGVGAVLVVFVAGAAGKRPSGKMEYDLLALWVAGIALTVVSLVDLPQAYRSLIARVGRLSLPGPETLFVLGIMGLTFLLCGVNQAHIPYVIHGDEAAMGLDAVGVLEGRVTSPFVTGWFGFPTLYYFIQAGFLRVWGINVAGLRFSSALVTSFASAMLYLFARHHFGRWTASLACLFFATYHFVIHYARQALNNIWDPFLALGVFYCANRGLETKRLGPMLVGAVLAGLSLYFYAGARSIAIVLFFYLAYWYWRERDRFDDRSAAHLVIFAWLALLVALPLLKFMLTHYQDMMAPWTRMALFGDPGRGRTHMELEMQRTGKTELGVMVDQVLKSFLAFNYYHDPTFHYRPEMPLLQFLPSIFFVFGIVYVFQNWRRREHFLLLVWFSLVLIFGGVLLENPPSSHRLILAAPPVAIFVALGVKALSSYVGVVARQSRTVAVAFSLVLVLIFGYQSVSFYFGKYSPERMFTNTNDEVANDLGKYLNFLGQGYQCYLFAAPRIYSGHPPIPFFSRGVVVTDIFEPIQPRADGQIPVPINREKDAVFVFLPERRNELDVVRLYYPEGLIREFRDFKGRLLFVSYEVLI